MAKPQSFAHVVLMTRRLDQMVDWYRKVLCVDVRFQHPVLTFLSIDEEHHRVALVNLSVFDPEEELQVSARAGSMEHMAFTYASAADLFENYARVKSLGIEPYWCIHHGMTLSMYYGDPDGNQIECHPGRRNTSTMSFHGEYTNMARFQEI